MTLKLKNLINYLQGKWISNQTIYSLKTKKIYNHQFTTDIKSLSSLTSNNSKNIAYITKIQNRDIIYQYIYAHLPNDNQGFINKTENKKTQQYIFIFNSNKVLKITNSRNNIKYIEYIYFIDKNFKFSFGVMKINNKYHSISFTSNIKISIAKTNSIE
uniref:hypothetical protein n=1 Tax=Hypnea nidifica TaxID=673448 RepID=UPI0027DAB13D|nr:hypothetical protein REP52_pgp121 [Hypnea nidifica]WCH54316.1 hypothetical protein [Hypnea nidifica]